jgi:hypothetical protein
MIWLRIIISSFFITDDSIRRNNFLSRMNNSLVRLATDLPTSSARRYNAGFVKTAFYFINIKHLLNGFL